MPIDEPPAPSDPPVGPRTVVVVLAAGAGSRFSGGGHKLDAGIDGEPLARRAVRIALEAAVGPVLVITGAHRPELPAGATEIHHPGWEAGQATSLAVGIDAASELGADAVVVGLADQPRITADAWRAVAASRSPIAVATYGGRRGNPVRLARTVWPLLPREGDQGARSLMQVRPDLVEPVPCDGSPDDIDTVEDLHRWQSNSSTNSP